MEEWGASRAGQSVFGEIGSSVLFASRIPRYRAMRTPDE